MKDKDFTTKGDIFVKDIVKQEEKIKYREQQKLTLVPESFCEDLPSNMFSNEFCC